MFPTKVRHPHASPFDVDFVETQGNATIFLLLISTFWGYVLTSMVCGNSGKIVSFCLGIVINPQLLIGKSREEIVKHYFLAVFSYGEILEFLKCYHNVNITLRQLNRILRKNSLYRCHMKTSLNAVIMKIKE